MKAYQYIFSKQVQWAINSDIPLIGRKGKRGRPAYTKTLEENLFEPLLPEAIKDLERGDGSELTGKNGTSPKMHALHSSSALGVNVFHYWLRIDQVPKIAAACGFCNKNNKSSQNIKFEAKFPISTKFRRSPNIDVIIENSEESKFRVFAIECKFSEAYSPRGHSGVDRKYLDIGNIWHDVPNLYKFAHSISPKDDKFTSLHPAQLVKHILGLKQKYGKTGFRLLYLWYDSLGREGAIHREEIGFFTEITKTDGIRFHALSYQELIIKLANKYLGGNGVRSQQLTKYDTWGTQLKRK